MQLRITLKMQFLKEKYFHTKFAKAYSDVPFGYEYHYLYFEK